MPDESVSHRVLGLRARRSQLQTKIDEWEATFARTKGRPATDKDRQRSKNYKEYSKLRADVDAFIEALQQGGSAPVARTVEASPSRGRTKARMRRWDREFERSHHRKPADEDREASDAYVTLRMQLHDAERGEALDAAADAAAGGAGSSAAAEAPAEAAEVPTEAAPAEETVVAPPVSWRDGGDYHELLHARMQSQGVVDGFKGRTAADIHHAAKQFSYWDIDRDGVLSQPEFVVVVTSLAEHSETELKEGAVQAMFEIADADGNGKIDFNEWLEVSRDGEGLAFRGPQRDADGDADADADAGVGAGEEPSAEELDSLPAAATPGMSAAAAC